MINRVDPDNLKRLRDIFSAEKYQDIDACKQALEELKDDVTAGLYPIHMAVYASDADLLQKLVDIGEDINEVDGNGDIPINLAVSSNNPAILDIVIKTKDLNLNKQVTIDRLTPLHIIAKENGLHCVDQMQALLKAGAKINVVDESGKTPLHYAAQTKNRDLINLLITEGASLDIVDKEGFTPFKDERQIADLHAGPRQKSAATKDFEIVIRAFISDHPPAYIINRLGEIEVDVNGDKYNLSKILEHKPDFEHINLLSGLSEVEVQERTKIATQFFRNLTAYRLDLDETVPHTDRRDMVFYEVTMEEIPERGSYKGELQVAPKPDGLTCICYGKENILIPWDKLPGFPQKFTKISQIAGHFDQLVSALNEIDVSIIPEAEARAIRYYTMAYNNNNAFLKINRFLRHNGQIDDLLKAGTPDLRTIMFTLAYLPQAITHLREHHNNAIGENQKPNQDVYRGETYDTKRLADTLIDSRTRQTLTTGAGFVSTSAKKDKADEFLNQSDEKTNINIQFTQPENSYGVDITKYSELARESEVLIMPGTQIIFRHSPYDDHALIATPVRTIDEIYPATYQSNLMKLRGEIIEIVDDYSISKNPVEAMIWTLDEFCRDFAKHEAGGLYSQLAACNKCIAALELVPQQVKLTAEYKEIRAKILEASGIVNLSLDKFIDEHFSNNVTPEFSSFIHAARHAYVNHLSKPFLDLDICGDDPYLEINKTVIFRPNHGLAHSIRTALYIPAICSALTTHAGNDEYKDFMTSLSQSQIYLMQLAMIFYVTGRKSEASWKDSPTAVTEYRKAAGENFHNYIENHKNEFIQNNVEFDKNKEFILLLENILSNANFKNVAPHISDLYVLDIIDLAHRMDLLRCFGKSDFEDAINQSCDQMGKYLDTSFTQKALPVLLQAANDSVAANGDRRITVYQGGKLVQGSDDDMDYKESFIAASSDPTACIKQCLTGSRVYLELLDGKLNIDLVQPSVKLTPLQEAILSNDKMEIDRILKSPGFDDQQYDHFIGKVIAATESNDKDLIDELIGKLPTYKNLNPGDMVVALHLALDKANENLALAIINKGVDLTFNNNRGETPLFVASKRNLPLAIKELAKGAPESVNTENSTGECPVCAAATRDSWDAVTQLINTTNIDLSGDIGIHVLSCAMVSDKEDIALAILASKSLIDVNKINDVGHSVLHYALTHDKHKIAEELLKRGATINSDSTGDNNYLDTAISHKAWHIVEQMIQDPSVDINNYQYKGHSLLSTALIYKQPQLIKLLLDKNASCTLNSKSNNPVIVAFDTKSPFIKELISVMMADKTHPPSIELKFLIMEKALKTKNKELINYTFDELYVKDKFNGIDYQFPSTGLTLVSAACMCADIESLREILKHSKHVETDCYKIGTPLNIAVSKSLPDMVDLLIEHGADINKVTLTGGSLLSVAAQYDDWKMVKHLLKIPGIRVDNDDKTYTEPFLCLMARSNDSPKQLFKQLLNDEKYIISPETMTEVLCTVCKQTKKSNISLNDILNNKFDLDLNKTDANGYAPLHHAAANGNKEALRTLLQHGADPNLSINSSGKSKNQSAIEIAAQNGHWELVNELLDVPGIVIDRKNALVNNVLHIACKEGKNEIVTKILTLAVEEKLEININALNNYGLTALHEAANEDHADIVNLLIRHNANVNVIGDEDDYFAIESAAANGSWNVVDTILNTRQININAEAPKFVIDELFYRAILDENKTIAHRLMEHDNFTLGYTNSQYVTAVRLLVEQDNFNILHELLKRPDVPGIETEINTVALDGDTPASKAAALHMWDATMNILNHPKAKLDYDHLSTLAMLAYACNDHRTDIVETIFEKFPPPPSLLAEVIHVTSVGSNNELIKLADYLLQHGHDANQKNSAGDTCLHLAVNNEHAKLTALLLKHHANISIPDASGVCVKQIKGLRGEIATLIDGARNEELRELDNHPNMKAAISHEWSNVENMLKSNTSEMNNDFLVRLLCHAVKDSQRDIIQLILPDLKSINSYISLDGKPDTTILVMATKQGDTELLMALLKRMPDSKTTKDLIRFAIDVAVDSKQWQAIIPLVTAIGPALSSHDIKNLFFQAVAANARDAVSFMMNNVIPGGASSSIMLQKDRKDKFSYPIHVAAKNGSKDTFKYLLGCIEDFTKDLNPVLSQSLLLAAQNKHWDIVNLILDRKDFSLEYTYSEVKTLLLDLAKTDQIEILKNIFTKYPEFSRNNNNNPSFFHEMIFHGSNVNDKENSPAYSKLFFLMLDTNKNLINAPDHNLNTPLHLAASRNNASMIKLLLQHGASTDAINKNDKTPVNMLPKQEGMSPDALKQREKSMKLLSATKLDLSGSKHSTLFSGHHTKSHTAAPPVNPINKFDKK